MPVNSKPSVTSKTKGKKPKNHKKKKTQKAVNFCDDENFDESLKIIKIEYCLQCPIFKEKSLEVFEDIISKYPNHYFKLLTNENEENFQENPPKSGSFEIYFAKNCREKFQLVWSGLQRGPPRREKFPVQSDYEDYIIKTINAILKTYDVCFFSSLLLVCCGDRCLILRSVVQFLVEHRTLQSLREFAWD